MMQKQIKKFLVFTLIISLAALPKNTFAQTLSDFENEVAKYTAELKAKQDKVAKNDAEVAEIKKKIASIESQIIEARNEIERLEEEIENVTESYRKKEIVGNINTNNRLDVDIDSIMKNSTDIQNTGTPIVHYKNEEPKRPPKKDSLFFNNLENEAANMEPTLSVGFNPFKTPNFNGSFATEEDDNDYDVLDIEEETTEEVKTTEKVPQVVELELEKNKDVIDQIKKTLSKAKVNGLNVESEEFSFDDMVQFVIRIKNED